MRSECNRQSGISVEKEPAWVSCILSYLLDLDGQRQSHSRTVRAPRRARRLDAPYSLCPHLIARLDEIVYVPHILIIFRSQGDIPGAVLFDVFVDELHPEVGEAGRDRSETRNGRTSSARCLPLVAASFEEQSGRDAAVSPVRCI